MVGYNTGKIVIGGQYMKPWKPRPMDADALNLQSALLNKRPASTFNRIISRLFKL